MRLPSVIFKIKRVESNLGWMMLTKKQYREAQKRALKYLLKAGVVLSEEEKQNIGVADFGLSDLEHQGGQILTFFNTDRISAKVIVLFPWKSLRGHGLHSEGNVSGKKGGVGGGGG